MTTIVTGGTKGIGLAIARRLARPGGKMVLAYHADEAAAESAQASLRLAGAVVTLARCDIGTIEGAAALMETAAELGEPVETLVHNAAMIYPTTLLEADLERFTQAIHTNGLSLLYLVQKAMPLLVRGS
ncbi:MAG TPA: SDR family oxidoreductase, partial [Caulobacteraceae bacterium]|nr:SDR family oxidoreductase [Caulobacteraceae bacterium]